MVSRAVQFRFTLVLTEAIDDAIKVLQGHFHVKDPTSLEDYLGVQIVQSDDGKKAWLGQPTII